MDLEKETGFQRTENKRKSEEEERKEKPESWSLRAGTTSRLPRGGLKGPPGQGSQRAVLSQGHACGGAGGEGGLEGGLWTATRLGGWECEDVRNQGLDPKPHTLTQSGKVKH